ncbi:MAG: DUF523 domain-containing protein [Deltaproteobacteria bacterium]|nr:DUF523 domain-containing protein [Deltaproteobacteria bacterium]MBW2661933.1 DUF523 domain-containing protein [Deltaproteobacteria bacterium]
MIAVSACLLGINCRYDGKSKQNSDILQRLRTEKFLPICPEQLGGLSTPRSPSMLVDGDGFDVLDGKAKVINLKGIDNTKAFIDGAFAALDQMLLRNITRCFLKNKSPS